MSDSIVSPPLAPRERNPWLAYYVAGCVLAWLLYVLAGTEFQRGLWQLWEAVYQATLSLWPPMLLGLAVHPWVNRLQRMAPAPAVAFLLHALAALLFGALWELCEFTSAWLLFGHDHAVAVLLQTLLWRAIWGVVAYAAIATGFTAMLQSRRARAAALAAAQAESALARAELAAISGKLNPHFLFNTLNSLIALTRKDASAAEAGLLRFAGMLRYVLDSKRSAADRVALADEVEFVRDYLFLESLRLGPRLRIDWQIDPATLADEIPPLTLQPLVENSVLHGVAPRVEGGRIRIRSGRDEHDGLALCVEDDGPGCDPATLEQPDAGSRRGIGLAALQRRFALDYEGRARLRVHTQPGAGFRVDLWIPQV
ncbi:sensor histidine kinase [Ideonella sp. BN130291]|uniref:sensor histidine kinase n=1 Tax=Ideonella sp. BN130291 TaxID=3112940 RepID=UPI002E26A637|nr:histidine kinase [Ideonella sp. BN130291]